MPKKGQGNNQLIIEQRLKQLQEKGVKVFIDRRIDGTMRICIGEKHQYSPLTSSKQTDVIASLLFMFQEGLKWQKRRENENPEKGTE